MKKLLLLSFAIGIIACKEEPKDFAIVSGKITNKQYIFTINSMDREFIDALTVDNDGTFMDTLRVKAGQYMFYDGKNFAPFYIENGNNIKITYDANDFLNTLNFSGEGSQISTYLKEKRAIEKELTTNYSVSNVYLLEEVAYKETFNKVKDSLTAYLTSINNIPDSFKEKEKRNLNYSYLAKLNIYKTYHSYYAKKPDLELSENFLSDLEGLDYTSEEDFDFSNDYANLVGSHYRKLAEEIVKTDSIPEDVANLKAISAAESELIKNKLLYDNAKYGITYTENLEDFYTTYIDNSTNDVHKAAITKSYDMLKTIDKGSPSPKFVDYENYNGGTTSLDDLKGKYVYIDVWATWCGPCKAEIPFLKEVEEKYHGKNIEFVSISIDKSDDHDKWKKMIEEKEMGGMQLFADNDWKSKFVEDYLIKGIPRFILIDTEGNIISSNAPRPSDSKLIDLFNEYNI